MRVRVKEGDGGRKQNQKQLFLKLFKKVRGEGGRRDGLMQELLNHVTKKSLVHKLNGLRNFQKLNQIFEKSLRTAVV